MQALVHPNVVSVLEEMGSDGKVAFFVMAYEAGSDLQRRVRSKDWDPSLNVPTLLKVGDALQHAHEHHLVHRDVKPANILLSQKNEPKLTDFDLVCAADTTGGTRTGPMGSFIYAAPEALKDASSVDARADVFSLSMVGAFLLHGDDLPPDALRNSAAFIEGLNGPPALKRVLAQGCAWNAQERFQTMREFTDALRAAAAGRVVTAEPRVPRPPAPPPSARPPSPAAQTPGAAGAGSAVVAAEPVQPRQAPQPYRRRSWSSPLTVLGRLLNHPRWVRFGLPSIVLLALAVNALPADIKSEPLMFLRVLVAGGGAGEEQQQTLQVALLVRLPRPEQKRQLMTRLPSSVQVTLRGGRSDLNELFREGLTPLEVDLRSGDRAAIAFAEDMFEIPSDIRVQDIDPRRIELDWQDIIDRQVPIQASVTGQPPDGYRVSGMRVEPPTVEVRGPLSLVEVLQFVRVAAFDASGKTDGQYRHRLALEPVPHLTYLETNSATVTMTIEQVKPR